MLALGFTIFALGFATMFSAGVGVFFLRDSVFWKLLVMSFVLMLLGVVVLDFNATFLK